MTIDDFWTDGDTGEALPATEKELHVYLAADVAAEAPAGPPLHEPTPPLNRFRTAQEATEATPAPVDTSDMPLVPLWQLEFWKAVCKGQERRAKEAEAVIASTWGLIIEAKSARPPSSGVRRISIADLEAILRAAPAGPPLHEPTDRDADNVPSDEDPAREYAEAVHKAMCPHRLTVCDNGPDRHHLAAARACVEVEKRHTADLRAEVERLRRGIRYEAEQGSAERIRQWERANAAEAKVARVEALRDEVRYRNSMSADWTEIDAALRGPAPTEEPS